jgi:hypothetical protein
MSRFVQARSGRASEPRGGYLTAEVCLSGHPTTGGLEFSPGMTARFCEICGSKTISACPECRTPLRGEYITGGISARDYAPPNHCHSCGSAFPWKTAKIEAAKEHAAEIEGLDENDKAQLKGAIDDLAAGGARTELAVSRFKRLMKKAGETVGGGLYKIVVDVATEAAKKSLIG